MAARIVILGAGESGTGAALLAAAKGFDVWVSDYGQIPEKYKQELTSHHIAFEEGRHTAGKILNAMEIIKSPGIPDHIPVLQKAKDAGIHIISEIEWASRFTHARVVAITGTNGKTTTTLLTYHLLKEAGFRVGMAGNVGHSFARIVAEEDDQYDWYVLEVSSFQLDQAYSFNPNIAVILNISPDHMDRYNNRVEEYVAAKFRLIQNHTHEQVFIGNEDDRWITMAKTSQNISSRTFTFSLNGQQADAYALAGQLRIAGCSFNINDLPLQGKHNYMNVMAACLAAMSAGVGCEEMQKALATFQNAPHRLEVVASINDVVFINDSKATNTDAVYYALESFSRPVIWIAGGVDKGNEYEELEKVVKQKVKALVCMGTNNKKLVNFFVNKLRVFDTSGVDDAIMKAWEVAEPGDAVVLSPACASFDLFKNYEDRGNQFRERVKALVQEVEKRDRIKA